LSHARQHRDALARTGFHERVSVHFPGQVFDHFRPLRQSSRSVDSNASATRIDVRGHLRGARAR
jgi:hypothetical protein